MKTSSTGPSDSRLITRLSPLFIGLLLSGCASITVPEKLRNLDIPANDPSFRTRIYAGATLGNSHLTPDTEGTAFNVDNSDDLGSQLRLGVDIHNMLSVELETSVLGTATLREAGTDVSYSAASVNALIYGLNGVQLRSRRTGWSAYGRLGMGVVKRSSAVTVLDEGGSSPIIGAGAEYGFPNGLGIRGEIVRFDSDAVYAGIGAVYRFGLSPGQIGSLLADAAEPALASKDRPVAAGGRLLKSPGRPGATDWQAAGDSTVASSDRGAEPSLGAASGFRPAAVSGVPRWRPVVYKDDHDRDGVRNLDDYCADTSRGVIVDEQGCGLFDELLADVIFKSGSHYLTARARGQLDEVAVRLLNFPEARVRVIAHTDSTGPADANLALSARRAESVVQYLQTRYVRELQLEALGQGETRPLASNRTAEGRKRNRRVELETVKSLSEAQLAESLERSDIPGEERWLPPLPGTRDQSALAEKDVAAKVEMAAKPEQAVTVETAVRPEVAAAVGQEKTAQVEIAGGPDKPAAALPVVPSGPDAVRSAQTVVPSGPDVVRSTQTVVQMAVPDERSPKAAASPELGAAVADVANDSAGSPEQAKMAVQTAVPVAPAAALPRRHEPLPTPVRVDGLDIAGVLEGVTFDKGSAALLPASRPYLAHVAAELRRYPQARLAIMAHTDNEGSEQDNHRLSTQRADTVLEHLVEMGIERSRLQSEGYGESLPLAQNVTAADRARNRRIELRLLADAP